jgi:hypothetical protein
LENREPETWHNAMLEAKQLQNIPEGIQAADRQHGSITNDVSRLTEVSGLAGKIYQYESHAVEIQMRADVYNDFGRVEATAGAWPNVKGKLAYTVHGNLRNEDRGGQVAEIACDECSRERPPHSRFFVYV